jgi:hypothetical protein
MHKEDVIIAVLGTFEDLDLTGVRRALQCLLPNGVCFSGAVK